MAHSGVHNPLSAMTSRPTWRYSDVMQS